MSTEPAVFTPLVRQAKILKVADCTVYPDRNVISRDGLESTIEPKVMQVLLYLAERNGEVATREQLHAEIWGGACVTDHVLTHVIWQLRHILGNHDLVQTVPKRGYRLTASVEDVSHPQEFSVRRWLLQRLPRFLVPLNL